MPEPQGNRIPSSEAIVAAARRPDVLRTMSELYEEVDRRIAELPGTCENRADCCRFGEFGHRLYVTTLETAYYLAASASSPATSTDTSPKRVASAPRGRRTSPKRVAPAPRGRRTSPQGKQGTDSPRSESAPNVPPITDDACPHAVEGRCQVRSHRPLGCRIFYCDPAAQPWQAPLTEELLTRLRAMHEELEVPYLYTDWMTTLRALSADPSSAQCDSEERPTA